MMVRIRATDSFNNQGSYSASSAFTLDTANPVISNVTAAQNVGASTVMFTYNLSDDTSSGLTVELDISNDNGSTWTVTDTSVTGSIGSGQSTGTDKIVTWDAGTDFGGQYQSDMMVRIRATDSFTNLGSFTSSSAFIVDTTNPVVSNVTAAQDSGSTNVTFTYDLSDDTSSDLTVELDISNDNGSTWTVTDTSVTGAVGAGQSTGTDQTITWDADADFDGQYQTDMMVRIRATDSLGNQGSYSASSAFTLDTANPVVSNVTAAQDSGSTNVTFTYDLSDDTNSDLIVELDISNDNGATWTVTDTSVTGAVGAGQSTGTDQTITWDADADFDGQYQPDMMVRIRATDSHTNLGSYSSSSAFALDTANPVIANVSASQNSSAKTVAITYDLSDDQTINSTVELEISNDGGSTWTVPITSATGDFGAGQTTDTDHQIVWDGSVDLDGVYVTNMMVRLRATDQFTNQGAFASSSTFALDTNVPVVSNVTALQSDDVTSVTFTYDLADDNASNLTTFLEISEDNGATWTVSVSSVSGSIGSGQTAGTSKTIVWDASTDFGDEYQTDLKGRVRATDRFGNAGGFSESAAFTIDTTAPEISNISVAQDAGLETVTVNYDLADDTTNNLAVQIEISQDGGTTWAVAHPTMSGDIGSGQSTGAGKTIVWDAGTDFNNQDISVMRVRLSATDRLGNTSSPLSSSDFALDTAAPSGLASLAKFASTSTSVTMTWNAATDSNFDRYELWFGNNQADVQNRVGTATTWSSVEDVNLLDVLTNATTITGITLDQNLFVKIWAMDTFGNEITTSDINVFTPIEAAGGGSVSSGAAPSPTPQEPFVDIIPPAQPILNPVLTPTASSSVTISGFAEPLSQVDLYDRDVLFERYLAPVQEDGTFSQTFTLLEGEHLFTVRATDIAGNVSVASNTLRIVIDLTAPGAPVVFGTNPRDTSETAPLLSGSSEPFATIEITLDDSLTFTAPSDERGNWRFQLPNSLALDVGSHVFELRARDVAGNVSSVSSLVVQVVIPLTPPISLSPLLPIPPTTGVTVIPPVITTPIAEIIREESEAILLPGLPAPTVQLVNVMADVGGNNFVFSGTSIPNANMVIYIHSNQALVYQSRANDKGEWSIDHSQAVTELTPGTHSIYAVAIDPVAKVKTIPSPIKVFEVKKNLWVAFFTYLNLQTTLFAVISLLLCGWWLFGLRKRELKHV